MRRAEPRAAFVFALRVALLFAASLMPLPWIADAYCTLFATQANLALSLVNENGRIQFHFESPQTIRPEGSWNLPLRVVVQDSHSVARPAFDVRSYSYRPMAMFLALAIASPLLGWRRNAVVLGGGSVLLGILTMLYSSLPILSRMAGAGMLGRTLGLTVETMYQALATPVMVYAMPLLLWWVLLRATEPLQSARDVPLPCARDVQCSTR